MAGDIDGATARAWVAWSGTKPIRAALRGIAAESAVPVAVLLERAFAAGYARGHARGSDAKEIATAGREWSAALSATERQIYEAMQERDRQTRAHFARVLGLRADASWASVVAKFEAMQETMRTLARWAASDADIERAEARALASAYTLDP